MISETVFHAADGFDVQLAIDVESESIYLLAQDDEFAARVEWRRTPPPSGPRSTTIRLTALEALELAQKLTRAAIDLVIEERENR